MTYTREQVAAVIDHAVLKPGMTAEDVRSNAAMCKARGVGNMCVRPCDVVLAVEALAGSGTSVASVIGFPHGANRSEVKALEARLAIEDGATELDMVMNIGRFLAGDHDDVRRDIEAVVREAKPHGVVVKVILETDLIPLDRVAEACEIACAAGADYVKTSTGFSGSGATPEAVDRMLKTVGDRMKVKASGGIRSWEDAVAYLEQGCARLGVGSTEQVLDGEQAQADY